MIATNTYPLSKIQEQFWILANLNPKDSAYNIPMVYRLKGRFETNAFKRALQTVIENHKILSSRIVKSNGNPSILVDINVEIENYFNVVEFPDIYSEQGLKEYIRNEVNHPFKIEGDYLFRIKLFKFNDMDFLSFVFHHIIIDLHSKNILVSELSKHYRLNVTSQAEDNEVLTSNYFHYTNENNYWLQSEQALKMKNQWNNVLSEPLDQLELPKSINNLTDNLTEGNRKYFEFTNSLSTQINAFAKNNNITPFVCLLSSWATFLHRITGQKKFSIGVPFTNRRGSKYKNTIGCFVNILPLIIEFNNDTHFNNVIGQVRSGLLKNHRKQEVPFLEIQNMLKARNNNIFQTGFTFEPPSKLELEGLQTQNILIERKGTQLEMFMILWELDGIFCGYLEYDNLKFNSNTAKKHIEAYQNFVRLLCEENTLKVNSIDILTNIDKTFIENFNNTHCKFEDSICIHEKFEIQVVRTPSAIALQCEKYTFSYRETEKHINRLANYLIINGVKLGDVIALCCERGAEMMISILAILKTGAAYLPLHLDNPIDRNKVILRDAKPKFVLCTQSGATNIEKYNSIIFIDDLLKSPLTENDKRPDVKIPSSALAYIIYTSGSTGLPKGTLIEHRSVINRIAWMQNNYPLTNNDTLLQKTPITFDVSVWELFWWFFNGSSLTILKHNGENDPTLITRYIKDYTVSQIHFVPSMFSTYLFMLKQQNNLHEISSLKTIFLSGESLPAPLVKEFNDLRQNYELPKLVNLYGPTEATVDVSFYNCLGKTDENDTIYIGKPIFNTGLYIVNMAGKVQPTNVKGELLITGVNLSRGYLNRPELTKKAFISFTQPNGEIVKAYKTGDICILRENAEIEYIGRADNQIKIRGLRIELGDIETKLLQHSAVKAATTLVAYEEERKAIIGYVELKPKLSISKNELTAYLTTKLPSYMIPSHIILMDKLPINANGKIDKKALPLPRKKGKRENTILPSNNIEQQLSQIWTGILGNDNLSTTDNFFDIGGNSLLSIKLSTHINQIFGTNNSVVSIMEYPNIQEYSSFLQRSISANSKIEDETPRREFKRRVNINKRNRLA